MSAFVVSFCLSVLFLQANSVSAASQLDMGVINPEQHHAVKDSISPSFIQKLLTSSKSIGLNVAWSDLGVRTTEPASFDANSPSDVVMHSVNQVYKPQNMTTEAAFSSQLGYVRVAAAWWSKDVPNSTFPVTVVTSGSMDRLSQLEAQCNAWSGPSSMVLFQGLLQREPWPLTQHNKDVLKVLVLKVSELMTHLGSKPGSCKPQVLLTYEIYTDPEALHLYPVNLLRNIARLQATTPLVALLDADLLPSLTMSQRFSSYSAAEGFIQEVEAGGKVYIIPALDLKKPYLTPDWAGAMASAPTKDIILWGFDNEVVEQFHGTRWPAGHRLTNFTKWQTATEDYVVEYEKRCEPWIIGPRKAMPWYDERYRGFGLNKIQHLFNLHADNFTFGVLHDSYLVHRPHKHAAAQKMYIKGRKISQNNGMNTTLADMKDVNNAKGLFQYLAGLFAEQVTAAKNNTQWKAVMGDTVSSCIKQLSHW